MNIIIDYREKSLIEASQKFLEEGTFTGLTLSSENLLIGDIIIKNGDTELIIIERKTIEDLISSISDGRYREQSFRLDGIEHENHNIIYLIEGSLKNQPKNKQKVFSAMFSMNYFKGFSIQRSDNVNESAYIILNMKCLFLSHFTF
jgi:ERCC4-type nuclease